MSTEKKYGHRSLKEISSLGESKAWADGYAAGKIRARNEIAILVAALYFTIALVGHLSA